MFGSVCRPKCKQHIFPMNCKNNNSGTFQYAVSDFTPWPIDMQAFSVTAIGSLVIATHIGGTLFEVCQASSETTSKPASERLENVGM
jgi:hypothetical protein